VVHAEPIRGAGSTFAAPVINKWSRNYEAVRTDGGDFTSPDWRVDYELVGSLAGVMRLDQPEMDFAATDAPLPPEEITKRGWVQFPVVMGGIVVVANIDNIAPGALRLTGPLLADIYLGKVTTWTDPAIKELNPDLKLPDATIEVLHRVDGSGSTFAFSSFLSKTSPEWQKKHGADTLISWTVGRSARGTSGLAALVAKTKNSIGYLEYGQVVRAKLPYVSLRNQAEAFIKPEIAAFEAGLAAIEWDGGRHFHADTTNLPGANAYPIATVTYVIIPKDRGRVRVNRVLDLFRLGLKQDARIATSLGYFPVSPTLVNQIETYWAKSVNSASH
jgi:phosphate transport system substrate-binding protein